MSYGGASTPTASGGPDRAAPDELRADCTRCVGLCCVAPAFARSSDFAITKPANQPCPNLGSDHRCGIHTSLRARGFPGCVVYDCFGAGQKITQVTFGGSGWHDAPDRGAGMFTAFPVMRDLHELLYYLTEAAGLPGAAPMRSDLTAAADRVRALSLRPAADLTAMRTDDLRAEINPLLSRASEMARAAQAGSGWKRADHRGANLMGASMRGADLRGASLRGARLIGADLRRADLAYADVTGADFRGADLRSANLAGTLFLTQAQLESARGDAHTRLPSERRPPAHWAAARS